MEKEDVKFNESANYIGYLFRRMEKITEALERNDPAAEEYFEELFYNLTPDMQAEVQPECENIEKETLKQIEAAKQTYENEISKITQDFTGKKGKLRQELHSLIWRYEKTNIRLKRQQILASMQKHNLLLTIDVPALPTSVR